LSNVNANKTTQGIVQTNAFLNALVSAQAINSE
jgi:hypothetical protein